MSRSAAAAVLPAGWDALLPDAPTPVWTKDAGGLSTNTYVAPLVVTQRVGWSEEEATHVMRWYNRFERSWVVSYAVMRGGRAVQVGSSEYVYDLAEALDLGARMVADSSL